VALKIRLEQLISEFTEKPLNYRFFKRNADLSRADDVKIVCVVSLNNYILIRHSDLGFHEVGNEEQFAFLGLVKDPEVLNHGHE